MRWNVTAHTESALSASMTIDVPSIFHLNGNPQLLDLTYQKAVPKFQESSSEQTGLVLVYVPPYSLQGRLCSKICFDSLIMDGRRNVAHLSGAEFKAPCQTAWGFQCNRSYSLKHVGMTYQKVRVEDAPAIRAWSVVQCLLP